MKIVHRQYAIILILLFCLAIVVFMDFFMERQRRAYDGLRSAILSVSTHVFSANVYQRAFLEKSIGREHVFYYIDRSEKELNSLDKGLLDGNNAEVALMLSNLKRYRSVFEKQAENKERVSMVYSRLGQLVVGYAAAHLAFRRKIGNGACEAALLETDVFAWINRIEAVAHSDLHTLRDSHRFAVNYELASRAVADLTRRAESLGGVSSCPGWADMLATVKKTTFEVRAAASELGDLYRQNDALSLELDSIEIRLRAQCTGLETSIVDLASARRARLMAVQAVFVAVFILVAIVTAARITLSITRPLKQMVDTFKMVALGKLETRVVIRGNDEFSELNNAFNHMAARVEESMAEISRSQETMRAANQRFRSVLQAATAYGITGTDTDGIINVFNDGAELMLGYNAEELIDRETPLIFHDPAEVAIRAHEMGVPAGFEVFASVAREGRTETREWTYVRKDGSRLTVSLTIAPLRGEGGGISGLIGIARETTHEKRMEQQLIQSQKMESVGLLAGGVAHDFNNLLTPIIGYADLLFQACPEGDPRRRWLQLVIRSVDRARDLTRRLLAFSRKQVMELKTVSLGEIVLQFEGMLRRTIHENIRIDVVVGDPPGLVRADPTQIEQVLLNLTLNAQDAMPQGGYLAIEVQDVELDEAYAATHSDVQPGRYVMLSVSDTGIGMDEQSLQHIFEPFYTTKERGKGTGLGLSIVYGIVKQHGGLISVYSEPGRGTTFKIFLSRLLDGEVPVARPVPSLPEEVAQGVETILVAEDNEGVRVFACQMLEGLGYHVITEDGAEDCLRLAEEFPGEIHMLLTDVIMPKMNGRELFEAIQRVRPQLRVLFMSGYTGNVIGRHGILDEGVDLLQKPFTRLDLSRKVREVLDGASNPSLANP